MNWISFKDKTPMSGIEYSYLITDGENIAIGWWEDEYFAENPEEELQYSSECWHTDCGYLKKDSCGWPEVTHWGFLPDLPK